MELFLNGQWVNHKFVPTRHYKEGRSYTATGYGARIPTNYMVFYPVAVNGGAFTAVFSLILERCLSARNMMALT